MKRRKPLETAENASVSERNRPPSRRRKRRFALGCLVFCLSLAGVDYWAYPYGAPVRARGFNRGENGLWLRYTWYFGQKSEDEQHALARQLTERQIRYAYFHVRGIVKTGKLGHRYRQSARRLVTLLHRAAPNVRLLAWIYAGNRRGMGEVDLSLPEVRKAMVEEAVWLVRECGFDGVQWDYEMCDDADPHFLALLRETHAALPTGALLGAATPMWLPAPFGRWGWSEAYFTQVAALCDQIAVMCYDSGAYFPRAYVGLVHRQAVHVTRAVARGNPSCRVLLGVPTYGSGLPSHNPRAETIGLALRGVREGLSDSRAQRSVFAGIAPFADYTTDPEAWKTYRRLWLTE